MDSTLFYSKESTEKNVYSFLVLLATLTIVMLVVLAWSSPAFCGEIHDAAELLSQDGGRAEVPPEVLRKIEADLVRIPAGILGVDYRDSEGRKHGVPDPRVKIASFMLSKHEVTQEEWTAVMASNPSSDQSSPGLPVTHVSWDDAQRFIARLNQAKGSNVFRLPTADEWEYACRAGEKGKVKMQATEAALSKYAWWDKNSGGQVHPVARLKPNAWGLYDILGNVEEWVQDELPRDPGEPSDGAPMRKNPGGSFSDPNLVGQDCSTSSASDQSGRSDYTGFRIAKSVDPDDRGASKKK